MFTHFIYMPWTGLGLHNGFRGNTWLRNRIKIFKEFVLPSILNQTINDKFYLWCSWRPEERNNPVVEKFRQYLNQFKGLSVIHTFGGLCFWDDKYSYKTASERLMNSLKSSLPYLKDYVGDNPYTLMTIWPSDDLYVSQAMEWVQEKVKELVSRDFVTNHVICFQKGYISNYATKEIHEYLNKTNPPFFTIVFSQEQFLNPEKHYYHTGPYQSHEYVINHLAPHFIDKPGFCVGTHNMNISTTFNHRFKGRAIEGFEKERLMFDLGITESEPLIFERPVRLWMRWLINKFPDKIRYHLLTFYYHKIYDRFIRI